MMIASIPLTSSRQMKLSMYQPNKCRKVSPVGVTRAPQTQTSTKKHVQPKVVARSRSLSPTSRTSNKNVIAFLSSSQSQSSLLSIAPNCQQTTIVTNNVLVTVTTDAASFKAINRRLVTVRGEKLQRAATAAACVKIQCSIRGALVRWNHNVPALKLTRKLKHIKRLKEKQLKKIVQRQVQAKLDFRVEMENKHPHRVLMRRLKMAESLQLHFQTQLKLKSTPCQELRAECLTIKAENEEIYRKIMTMKEDSKAIRRGIIHSGFKTRELQGRCREYKKAVDIWEAAVAEEANTDAISS